MPFPFTKMNSWKQKNLLLFFFSFLTTILLVEVALRLTGTRPGWIKDNEGFSKVDSLIIFKNFTTDEFGIYKFSPWVTDSMLKYFDCNKREIVNPELKKSFYEFDNVSYIYESFCKQHQEPEFSIYWNFFEFWLGEADSNCLTNTKERIVQNSVTADSVWKGAFFEYFSRPFNHDGFRSVPFKNYATKQLKVLIIGDSFVYGMDAHPYQNSFTDLLLSRGYLVYAAGIPGTDPAQYAAIAQKYVPILKPDVVVSCFFVGNDFMRYEREPDSTRPHEHLTNAGLIASAPYGKYLPPNEAYQFYLSLSTFPDERNLMLDKICARFSISTLVWNVFYKKGIVRHTLRTLYNNYNLPQDTINKRTKKYTDRMVEICRENKIPLVNAIIPERQTLIVDSDIMRHLFEGGFYVPEILNEKDDFYRDKVHFNNSGSFKFANFLDTLLQTYAKGKTLSLQGK